MILKHLFRNCPVPRIPTPGDQFTCTCGRTWQFGWQPDYEYFTDGTGADIGDWKWRHIQVSAK